VLRDPVSKYPPNTAAVFLTMTDAIASAEADRQSRLQLAQPQATPVPQTPSPV
jgi:hypothetical protein